MPTDVKRAGDMDKALAVSIPSSSGQWCQRERHGRGGEAHPAVSIPSSSGQWCQLGDDVSVFNGMKAFQSLLHQVSGANFMFAGGMANTGVEFQSLLHQVSGANWDGT